MRQLAIIFCLLLTMMTAQAQRVVVKDFKLRPNDLAACEVVRQNANNNRDEDPTPLYTPCPCIHRCAAEPLLPRYASLRAYRLVVVLAASLPHARENKLSLLNEFSMHTELFFCKN